MHEAVCGLARAGGVPVIDLLSGLARQDPPSLWVSPGDAHPNERACELFAAQLYSTLAAEFARPTKD